MLRLATIELNDGASFAGYVNGEIAKNGFLLFRVEISRVKAVSVQNQIAAPMPHSIERITNAVAEFFEVTPEQILSRCRTARVIVPRFVAMQLAHETTNNASEVARWFQRDHGAVLNALKKLSDWSETDPMLREKIEASRKAVATGNFVRVEKVKPN